MSTEKTRAAAESAAALSRSANAIGERLADAAAEETRHAMDAAQSALAASPTDLIDMQINYTMGWMGRVGAQWMALSAELTEAQNEALAPIHKTATENAERLKDS